MTVSITPPRLPVHAFLPADSATTVCLSRTFSAVISHLI